MRITVFSRKRLPYYEVKRNVPKESQTHNTTKIAEKKMANKNKNKKFMQKEPKNKETNKTTGYFDGQAYLFTVKSLGLKPLYSK